MQNIFLIGLSGSGKSTIALLLAERLRRPLFDIDALLEKECGEPIASLFTSKGEEFFRACESHMLTWAIQAAKDSTGAIIATGGGIVLRPENRRSMAEHGIRVYLTVKPDTALQRLQAQQGDALAQGSRPEVRPLLVGADPLAALQSLLSARSSWYEEAEIICSTDSKNAETVAQEVIAVLISFGIV